MNGICKIVFDGKEIGLLFGMKAIRIYFDLVAEETDKLNIGIEDPKDFKKLDNETNFICLVYAGMCNDAEMNRQPYPKYEDCYLVADFLFSDHAQQTTVWNTFTESRAGSDLLAKFSSDTKKKKQPIGKKLKPTQSGK